MEELIDELTGEPLQAGEREAQGSVSKQQSAGDTGKAASGLTADDKQ